MLKKARNTNQGFTLVESVMAVMVLGIALGACLLSFDLGIRCDATAANQMAAMHVARGQVETLRTYSYSNSVWNAGSYVFTNNGMAGTYVITNFNSNVKSVAVSVPYLNRIRGGSLTNTLTTLFSSTLHP